MQLTASAPGKLVLSGEYAVLAGAPGVAVAVNRRAHVRFSRSHDEYSSVTAPGLTSVTGRFRTEDGFEWLSGREDFALLEHIWTATGARHAGHWSLELDSHAFADAATGDKLGIGSSAALSVALAHALAAACECSTEPARAAFAGHRRFQDGLGSGIDVACSLLGGLVGYSMDADGGRHLDWPDGLYMAVLWLGLPASTRDRLERLEGQPVRASREELVLASDTVAAAWREGSAQAILAAYVDYIATLRAFSADHDLGIFDAGHAELVDAAGAGGVIYKPCGAGGGDCGVCLAEDAAALAAFLDHPRAKGAYRPDIGMDFDGVQVSGEVA